MIALIILSVAASALAETRYYNGFSLNNNLDCHQLGWPPMSEAQLDTKFYMYTPSSPNGVIVQSGDMSAMLANGFNSRKPTHIFTHGYNSDSQGSSSFDIYDAFMAVAEANVFAVDWRNGAKVANYNYARQNIRVVGNQIAIFVQALRDSQSLSKIYLAGHSLGAHASGYAGEALKNNYGGTVTRITGLDPAGPGFWDQDDARCRLDPTDADFVDNIHTDDDMYGSANDLCDTSFLVHGDLVTALLPEMIGHLSRCSLDRDGTLLAAHAPEGHLSSAGALLAGNATWSTMGHVDFYPNGGSNQPGCTVDVASCSHSKVKLFYAESITATSCKFTSYQCSSWANYNAGKCTSCGSGCCNYMGYHAVASCSGKRYLKTNANAQYCIS